MLFRSDGAITEDPRQMRGRPGTRLPHVVLERDGAPVSSIDLVDSGFALFAGPDGGAWSDTAGRAAREFGVTCPAFPLGGSYDAFGISPSGAVLVRPDNVIAWRSLEGGASPAETMSRVFRAMLGRR